MTKVLLYSGGLDSWLIDKLWKPDKKIYVNIDGDYNKAEIARLPKDVKVVDFPLLGKFEDKETHFVPLRNLYFLMIATHYGDEICFGATKGDRRRNDKTPEFVDKTEDLLRYTMGIQRGIDKESNIHIERRFMDMYKHELIQEYLSMGGKIKDVANATFSCYTPDSSLEPCWYCRSCFKKVVEMMYFGYTYPEEISKKVYEYAKKEIVPKSKNGGVEMFAGRGKEGDIWKQGTLLLYKMFNGNYKQDLNK